MKEYVTGAVIRRLREAKQMTQEDLAQQLYVSSKTISKWETGAGLPDISLLEPLAKALDISIIELLGGEDICNRNRSCNMLRSRLYTCPVCGNVIHATGEALVSCCGLTLPPLCAQEPDEAHHIQMRQAEDEYYISMAHPMCKTHYISFFAALSDNALQLVKLYPEGNAEARFKINRVKVLYAYCNRHGLFKINLRKYSQPGGPVDNS